MPKLGTGFHLHWTVTFDVVPRKEDMYDDWGPGFLAGMDSTIPISGQHLLFDDFPNDKASVYRLRLSLSHCGHCEPITRRTSETQSFLYVLGVSIIKKPIAFEQNAPR